MADRPPEKRKGPLRRHPQQGPIRINSQPVSTSAAPVGQPPCENFSAASLHTIVARLRDDGMLPIRVRLLALQASYRLRFGGDIGPDEQRQLRRLHAQRRRELAAAARAYGLRS